jgi:hypothetical protein
MSTFTSIDQAEVRRWLQAWVQQMTTDPAHKYMDRNDERVVAAIEAMDHGVRVTVTNDVVDPFEGGE